MTIHPTAVVSPDAKLGLDVEIGPFSVVDSGAIIGDRCRLSAYVHVREATVLGEECVVCEGTVLGGMPQHVKVPDCPGTLTLGKRCIIREHVTVHRSMEESGSTQIGDDCMLMVGSHVAHDCQLGNSVILTNGVKLGGHVVIGDRACLGGSAAVHQFCRVGRLAMVGAFTKVVQDVPPFMLADGSSAFIVGLNQVGLRRAGYDREKICALKTAYRLIYREGLLFEPMVAALETRLTSDEAAELAQFFRTGRRGFVQERRRPPHVALRVHPVVEEKMDHQATAPEQRRLAG